MDETELETILNSNLIQHSSFIYRRFQIPLLNRDFRNIYANEEDFNHVSTHPGHSRKLFATGSGIQTDWYLYNSPQYHKLFMIWISPNHCGFRDDIERIEIMPRELF